MEQGTLYVLYFNEMNFIGLISYTLICKLFFVFQTEVHQDSYLNKLSFNSSIFSLIVCLWFSKSLGIHSMSTCFVMQKSQKNIS